jgi:hypothetical protein
MPDVLAEALWDAIKHPRGRGGLFKDVFKPEVAREIEQAGTKIERARPTIQRRTPKLEQTGAWKRAKLRPEFLGERGPHGDEFMYELARDMGFAGKPHKVAEADLAQRIEAGDIELFRGVTDESYARELTDGSYFAGQGFRGNGIYAAADGDARRHATAYAQAPPTSGITGKTDKPVVIHMALLGHARIEDYDKVSAEAKRVATVAQRDMQSASDERARLEAERRYHVARDPSRFAMSQGIDAVRVSGQEYVILNRTALVVSEEFRSGGTNVVRQMRQPAGAT